MAEKEITACVVEPFTPEQLLAEAESERYDIFVGIYKSTLYVYLSPKLKQIAKAFLALYKDVGLMHIQARFHEDNPLYKMALKRHKRPINLIADWYVFSIPASVGIETVKAQLAELGTTSRPKS